MPKIIKPYTPGAGAVKLTPMQMNSLKLPSPHSHLSDRPEGDGASDDASLADSVAARGAAQK